MKRAELENHADYLASLLPDIPAGKRTSKVVKIPPLELTTQAVFHGAKISEFLVPPTVEIKAIGRALYLFRAMMNMRALVFSSADCKELFHSPLDAYQIAKVANLPNKADKAVLVTATLGSHAHCDMEITDTCIMAHYGSFKFGVSGANLVINDEQLSYLPLAADTVGNVIARRAIRELFSTEHYVYSKIRKSAGEAAALAYVAMLHSPKPINLLRRAASKSTIPLKGRLMLALELPETYTRLKDILVPEYIEEPEFKALFPSRREAYATLRSRVEKLLNSIGY